MIRYAKLSLPFEFMNMQNELSSIQTEWQAHFNTFYFEGSWTVLALRSPSGDHKNIIPDMMTNGDYQDTMHMQRFPSVRKLLTGIDCPIMSARFLNLQAGAVIKPHRDNELAFEKGEARLHFPVITNSGVEFYVEDDRVFLQEGDCWYINANLQHSVLNKGSADRIHLVVDCKVNDWLSALVNSSTDISYKEDNDQMELLNIIRALRLQNTNTSNLLALQLERQLNGQTKKEQGNHK